MANMDLFGNWGDVFALVGKNEHPSAVIWGALDEVRPWHAVHVCVCVCVRVSWPSAVPHV
jgi:hypothetical protein